MTEPFAARPLGARLRLLRFSNVASPMADVLAGAAVAAPLCKAPIAAPRLWVAMVASAALYHAGMAFNDVADRAEDRRTRPDRPIVSGRVTSREAIVTATLLLSTGVGLSLWIGNAPVVVPLAAVVLLYDFATPRGSLAGPLLLGAARALNVLAGSVAAGMPLPYTGELGSGGETWVLGIASGYGIAIGGLSLFALGEDRPWSALRASVAGLTAFAGLVFGYACFARLQGSFDRGPAGLVWPPHVAAVVGWALCVAWIPLVEPASVVLGASRPWTGERVGQVVGAGLRSTFVFHALLFLLCGWPTGALFCGVGYAVGRVLARWIPPT